VRGFVLILDPTAIPVARPAMRFEILGNNALSSPARPNGLNGAMVIVICLRGFCGVGRDNKEEIQSHALWIVI